MGYDVCVSDTGRIQLLKINCSSWGPVFLRYHYHSGTPDCWSCGGHRFYDAQRNVLLEIFFYGLLPMQWYGYWCMDCMRGGIMTECDCHKISCHGWKRLVRTDVKGTCSKEGSNESVKLHNVIWHRPERNGLW